LPNPANRVVNPIQCPVQRSSTTSIPARTSCNSDSGSELVIEESGAIERHDVRIVRHRIARKSRIETVEFVPFLEAVAPADRVERSHERPIYDKVFASQKDIDSRIAVTNPDSCNFLDASGEINIQCARRRFIIVRRLAYLGQPARASCTNLER